MVVALQEFLCNASPFAGSFRMLLLHSIRVDSRDSYADPVFCPRITPINAHGSSAAAQPFSQNGLVLVLEVVDCR